MDDLKSIFDRHPLPWTHNIAWDVFDAGGSLVRCVDQPTSELLIALANAHHLPDAAKKVEERYVAEHEANGVWAVWERLPDSPTVTHCKSLISKHMPQGPDAERHAREHAARLNRDAKPEIAERPWKVDVDDGDFLQFVGADDEFRPLVVPRHYACAGRVATKPGDVWQKAKACARHAVKCVNGMETALELARTMPSCDLARKLIAEMSDGP